MALMLIIIMVKRTNRSSWQHLSSRHQTDKRRMSRVSSVLPIGGGGGGGGMRTDKTAAAAAGGDKGPLIKSVINMVEFQETLKRDFVSLISAIPVRLKEW